MYSNVSAPASPPSSCVASGGPAQVKVNRINTSGLIFNGLTYVLLSVQGRNCIFPFTYLGVKYSGCAPLYG